MQSTPNNKPYLIYLSHENKECEKKLEELILKNIRNVKIRRFCYNSIGKDSKISNADLIIVDMLFDKDRIEKIHRKLISIYHKVTTPYLLVINDTFKEEEISFFQNYPDLVYDFANETVFNKFVFINRIKVLLSIPKISKISDCNQKKIQDNIWKLLDYSNIFVVVLDKELNIRIGNYHLANRLGFKSEDDLTCLSWKEFLKPSDIELVKHVNEEVAKNNKEYKEFSYDILDENKQSISVKWFNTFINSEFNCVFSIGIPLTKTPSIDEDIDSIRSYFRDILERDKTTINAMKEVTLKHSEKILKNRRKVEFTNV